jgi:pilus assembly protein CpaB
MRRTTLIALGAAVILGLFAVYLANVFLTSSEKKVEEQKVTFTKVAVAAVPLEYGTDIGPEKVKFVDYPSSSVPPGSFANFNQLVPAGKRRVVIRGMQVNEPILASKLGGEGMGPSIAYLLPDGMRAAAVRVNDVSGVAGFVQPNDTVDVLITRDVAGRSITDVLLQNVRVIALDQNATGADGKPNVARTATLEVSPTDAQKLALSQQAGSLSLVLRKPGVEQNIPAIRTVDANDLRYSYYSAGVNQRPVNLAAAPEAVRKPVARVSAPRRPTPRLVVRPAPAPPPTNNVEVVRGTKGSNYEVGGYGS